MLQSTFSSKLLNLGQITSSTSPAGTKPHLQPISSLYSCYQLAGHPSISLSVSPAPQHLNAHSLSSLCGFLRVQHPLLVSLTIRPPQDLNRLPYVTLRSLRVDTLVHALLRVTHTHLSSGKWVTGVR